MCLILNDYQIDAEKKKKEIWKINVVITVKQIYGFVT